MNVKILIASPSKICFIIAIAVMSSAARAEYYIVFNHPPTQSTCEEAARKLPQRQEVYYPKHKQYTKRHHHHATEGFYAFRMYRYVPDKAYTKDRATGDDNGSAHPDLQVDNF
ncbi:MAG TPA: hypothetical protein VHZ76_06510 [Gammaproteobacteria bacterium]|jgi:hypothetical protein|nr:hypothetical protein [Gammaproteobacteria bacterium]